MKNKKTLREDQAYINPSYDKSLSVKERLADFLGAYHLILNGVKAHEPFDLKYEGKPNEMCDQKDKERLIEFVNNMFESKLKQREAEVREEIKHILNPDLKRFATEPIGKIVDEWFRLCDELGLEIVFQDIGDEVLGKRKRPIKAITNSPIKEWQQSLNQNTNEK